jgi:hypothetical protein
MTRITQDLKLKSYKGWRIVRRSKTSNTDRGAQMKVSWSSGNFVYIANKKGVYHYANSLQMLKNRIDGTQKRYIKGW